MGATEGITTQYSNSVMDFVYADLLWRSVRDSRIRMAAVVIAGFAIYAYITNSKQWYVAAILMVAALAAWNGLLSFNPARAIKAVRKTPLLLGPYVITLSGDGIHLSRITVAGGTAQTSEFNYKWSEFSRYIENGSLFVLIGSGRIFPIVPKRAFETREQISQVRALLKSSIGRGR